MTRPLIRTPAFVRDVRRATRRNAPAEAAIEDVLPRLEADAFDPSLDTHKLGGKLDGWYACSAGYDLRVIFRFTSVAGVEHVLLLACGTHDDVY